MARGNKHISCIVSECMHHAKKDQLCTLKYLQISRNGTYSAATKEFTECGSFEQKF